jgi:hypothetical protein
MIVPRWYDRLDLGTASELARGMSGDRKHRGMSGDRKHDDKTLADQARLRRMLSKSSQSARRAELTTSLRCPRLTNLLS